MKVLGVKLEMANLIPENTVRKVDSLGRVVIPKALRSRFCINENDEVGFLTLEFNGGYYICFTNGKTVDPRYQAAASVLKELGIEVPQELQSVLEGN